MRPFCQIVYPVFFPLTRRRRLGLGLCHGFVRDCCIFTSFKSISLWAWCNQDLKVKRSVSLLCKAQDHSNCLAGVRDRAAGLNTKINGCEKGYIYLSSVGPLKVRKSDNAPEGSSCACAVRADELNTCPSTDFRYTALLEMRLYLKEQALIIHLFSSKE